MLWFLSLAAESGFRVDDYFDEAEAVMGKNAAGRTAVTRATLRPRVTFSGDRQPSRTQLDELHHKAHEECFIANSITTEILCEPVYSDSRAAHD